MNLYRELLFTYADGLLRAQVEDAPEAFRGGIVCPSCKNIHGRCIDAVYGLSVAYKLSKNPKYLHAAELVFAYGKQLECTDHGIYNDAQTEWRFTTTFQEIDLVETLLECGEVLPDSFKKDIENRATGCADWLFHNLDEHSSANINYCTTNALALALAGTYFQNESYLAQAKHLASYAISHVSPSHLFYGEGKPHDAKTEKGCLAIDLGYNLEESLPALAEYAFLLKDEELKKKLLPVIEAHADFLLPDGAVDNSFGCRNYKWTYYGSRTCDGLAPLFLLFADKDPSFPSIAYRNASLLKKCTHEGYLYGGPDYWIHGEYPCTHHTFEHINALAYVLTHIEEKYLGEPNALLPSETKKGIDYYPEMDSYRFSNDHYAGSITAYDVNIPYSGHASGGTLTSLYSREKGPLIMGSVTEYRLTESTNMQVPLDREHHRSLLPRVEEKKGGVLYSSTYFRTPKCQQEGDLISYETRLANLDGEPSSDAPFRLSYTIQEEGIFVEIEGLEDELRYTLPLIRGEADLVEGKLVSSKPIFFLTPGFMATEFVYAPRNGRISLLIHG